MPISSQDVNEIIRRFTIMTYDGTYMYNGLIIPIEIWKPITEEMVPNIKPIYFVSNIGNIYNSKTGRYSCITLRPGKYVQVTLSLKDGSQTCIHIHRLVCMAFNGMPLDDTYEVDHINCDKTCNYSENLEWVTPKENINRAYINNLIKFGEDNYRAILTNEDVVYICELLMLRTPISEICTIMEQRIYPRVYPSGFKGLISHILCKDVWKEICSGYDFPDYSRLNFTDDQVHFICQCLTTNMRYDDILIALGITNCYDQERRRLKETIYKIKAGKSYTHISCNYNITMNKSYVLSNDEVDFVCRMVVNGVNPTDILNSMGDRGKVKNVRAAVSDIYHGICHIKEVNYYKSQLTEGSTTIEKDS